MKPNAIRTWRPPIFDDYIGAANSRPVRRLQQAAIRREPPRPLLLIGPYGASKTSLARHLIASFCCENPSPHGDPCHKCHECARQGAEHNGEGLSYAHWELDCTRYLHRNEVRQVIQEIDTSQDVAVFWDEFSRLRAKSAQPLLLKPSEDIHGIWIVAMTSDHYRTMDAQLFERFRKVWLTIPTADEMVAFFKKKATDWGVIASEEIIRLMVDRTQRSFRSCLDLLAAGAENEGRLLDRDTLEEFFTLDQTDTESFTQLFGDPEE